MRVGTKAYLARVRLGVGVGVRVEVRVGVRVGVRVRVRVGVRVGLRVGLRVRAHSTRANTSQGDPTPTTLSLVGARPALSLSGRTCR